MCCTHAKVNISVAIIELTVTTVINNVYNCTKKIHFSQGMKFSIANGTLSSGLRVSFNGITKSRIVGDKYVNRNENINKHIYTVTHIYTHNLTFFLLFFLVS